MANTVQSSSNSLGTPSESLQTFDLLDLQQYTQEKSFATNASKDFLVDRSAVQMVREALCYQNEVVDSNTRKIYLGRREGQMRNIINIDQVDSMMENLGFEVVFTDIMSLDEQMDLFKSAKIVVGAAGAAFSNMIFMQQGANVVMFSPSIKKTNYYIFQQIAEPSSCQRH